MTVINSLCSNHVFTACGLSRVIDGRWSASETQQPYWHWHCRPSHPHAGPQAKKISPSPCFLRRKRFLRLAESCKPELGSTEYPAPLWASPCNLNTANSPFLIDRDNPKKFHISVRIYCRFPPTELHWVTGILHAKFIKGSGPKLQEFSYWNCKPSVTSPS